MPGLLGNRTDSIDHSRCFVMMPFAEQFNAIYRLIQRVCTDQGLTCQRADEDVKPGKITSKIYDSVAEAGIIIADMTGRNPNVFYELGLAHAVSDSVILLTQSSDDVPFDLKDFIHIQYTNSFEGAEKLASDLSKVLTIILRSAETQIVRKRQVATPEIQAGNLAASADGATSDSGKIEQETDLAMLHLRAEISRNDGNLRQARDFLQRAIEIARALDGEANEIGNCAIEAEKCKFFDLAEELYVLAIERDPNHVNNRQCYASFLLDYRAKRADALTKARGIIDELEKVPERQERTRALRAQLLTLGSKGDQDESDLDRIISDMLSGEEPLNLNSAAPLLLVMQRARQFDRFAQLIEKLKSAAPSEEAWQLDRALADCFATSGQDDLRRRAIDTYERLILDACDQSPGIKHNLATLYYSMDKPDKSGRAMKLWREAYAEEPNEMSIRRGFAGYLTRHNKNAEASAVLEGKPLDGVV